MLVVGLWQQAQDYGSLADFKLAEYAWWWRAQEVHGSFMPSGLHEALLQLEDQDVEDRRAGPTAISALRHKVT